MRLTLDNHAACLRLSSSEVVGLGNMYELYPQLPALRVRMDTSAVQNIRTDVIAHTLGKCGERIEDPRT